MFRKISLSLFLVLAVQSLQADYIIVKRVAAAAGGASVAMGGAGGVAPLATGPLQVVGPDNTTPEQQAELYRIMMTYEWPMSSAAYEFGKITREEADKLFAPGVDSAEQNFIRKKIQTSALLGPDFDLVFVPKTLYELFVMKQLCNGARATKDARLILSKYLFIAQYQESLFSCDIPGGELRDYLACYFAGTDIGDAIFNLCEAEATRGKLTALYTEIQNKVLEDPRIQEEASALPLDFHLRDVYLMMNKAIGEYFLHGGVLKPMDGADPEQLEKAISTGYPAFVGEFIKETFGLSALTAWDDLPTAVFKIIKSFIADAYPPEEKLLDVLLECKNINHATNLVCRVIALEYAFKAKNYGMLMRGLDWSLERKIFHEGVLDAAGPVLAQHSDKLYKTASLSFGNSLFAGLFFDARACAYFYGCQKTAFYALEVDKKSYVLNHCDELFVISPLPTINALMNCGEFFHSRGRAMSPGKTGSVRGIAEGLDEISCVGMKMLRTDGEFFQQELLFQLYFLEHAHVIKAPVSDEVFKRGSRAAVTAMKAMWEYFEKQKKAATKIQAVVRGHKVRKKASALATAADS